MEFIEQMKWNHQARPGLLSTDGAVPRTLHGSVHNKLASKCKWPQHVVKLPSRMTEVLVAAVYYQDEMCVLGSRHPPRGYRVVVR